MSGVITLLTDFGLSDGYVAAMKGVILTIAPDVRIVDITHEIAPQDICGAGFVLASVYQHFPPGTVHVAVVDPGVGSERRAVAVEAGGYRFVAPDNGLLSRVIQGKDYRAVVLDEPGYWRTDAPSATFHGRDIFAPVAAHLATGVALNRVGSAAGDLLILAEAGPSRRRDGCIVGHVVYIDRFGNLITDIPADWVAPGDFWRATCCIHRVERICGTYADAAPGELVALVGSEGYLELAVREGSAADRVGAVVGTEVILDRAQPTIRIDRALSR